MPSFYYVAAIEHGCNDYTIISARYEAIEPLLEFLDTLNIKNKIWIYTCCPVTDDIMASEDYVRNNLW